MAIRYNIFASSNSRNHSREREGSEVHDLHPVSRMNVGGATAESDTSSKNPDIVMQVMNIIVIC